MSVFARMHGKTMWLKAAVVAGLSLCLSTPVWAVPDNSTACGTAVLKAQDALNNAALNEGVRACLKGLPEEAVANLNSDTLAKLQAQYEKAYYAALEKFGEGCGKGVGENTGAENIATEAALVACGAGDVQTLLCMLLGTEEACVEE